VFFRGYLLSFMAWLGIALGSMVILMLRHLTKGGWGMIIRRILGAAMRTLPLLALLFIPLLFALPRLYPWARPLGDVPDKNLRQHLQNITHSYLNVHGFIIRAIIYFAIWGTLIFLLTKWSKEQDRPPVRDNSARFKVLSGPGIILYGFTISFAAIDWTMSLDPSWISTIYPLIILIGEVLSALCFAVVIERILFRYRPMSELLKPEYVHDHGKFMLTRYLDLFWVIEPNFSRTITVTWADIIVPVAMGGLWLAYFCRNLASMPLVPAYDVFASEVLQPAHEKI